MGKAGGEREEEVLERLSVLGRRLCAADRHQQRRAAVRRDGDGHESQHTGARADMPDSDRYLLPVRLRAGAEVDARAASGAVALRHIARLRAASDLPRRDDRQERPDVLPEHTDQLHGGVSRRRGGDRDPRAEIADRGGAAKIGAEARQIR